MAMRRSASFNVGDNGSNTDNVKLMKKYEFNFESGKPFPEEMRMQWEYEIVQDAPEFYSRPYPKKMPRKTRPTDWERIMKSAVRRRLDFAEPEEPEPAEKRRRVDAASGPDGSDVSENQPPGPGQARQILITDQLRCRKPSLLKSKSF